jgi:hypothetical protein
MSRDHYERWRASELLFNPNKNVSLEAYIDEMKKTPSKKVSNRANMILSRGIRPA